MTCPGCGVALHFAPSQTYRQAGGRGTPVNCPTCGPLTIPDPTWLERDWEFPVIVEEVGRPHPRARIIDEGDQVYLHTEQDDMKDDVRVQVAKVAPDGKIQGVISRPNRWGAHGVAHFAVGVSVECDENNVFRLEKAAAPTP